MIHLKYRPDIDGLRAVAVLGVVIYHAFPWMIPGGFIGVDIFFVISGYLISGILYKGLKANGGDGNFSPFSFREFYARRIRRLFPALITMLVITLAYGWLILLPDEFEQLGKHVAAGTLFIQNIVFWQESGYFDTAASLKPLLHLWSLAVEEQFYIFFPLLLMLLWRKPKILAPAMGVLLIATFILNVVMSVQNRASDFFLTPYRAWEFLGGSLLAWWHYDKGHEKDEPLYREALSWIGVTLLALGFAFIHTGDPYPGWRALLPVLGTLLLMEGGMSAWLNRKMLSHPAVVWIGLISYPLYLFHWPAISFVHIVKGDNPKVVYVLGALGIALLLSVLTYYCIEKKIRRNTSQWIVPILVVLFILNGLIGGGIKLGIIKPNIRPKLAKIFEILKDKDFFEGLKQHASSVGLFTIGGHGQQTIFLGDSNMEQYAPRITMVLRNHKGDSRGAIFVVYGGLPPIPNYVFSKKSEPRSLMPEFEDQIKTNPKIDRVVITALWPEYFIDAQHENTVDGISAKNPEALNHSMVGLGNLIRKLVLLGKKVTVVLSIPYDDSFNPRIIVKRELSGAVAINPPAPLTRDSFLSMHGKLIEKVRSTALLSGAEVIDPVDYLCKDGLCIREDKEGIPIRYDHAHLRPGYVRDHVKYLDETVAP